MTKQKHLGDIDFNHSLVRFFFQRPLDVLKIDVEGHEWAVIENLLQDKMFLKIRQFMLEYHLFPD
jgi:hypothetical protein